MRRTIVLYGLAMAVLLGILKYIEYRFFVRDIPLEVYIGVVAVIFTAVGIWAGKRLTRVHTIVRRSEAEAIDTERVKELGISRREYEVLELIANGLSNKEIAERLFVSTSTVKTHTSNLFTKLDARRRTQAIQRAKELQILN